MTSCTVYRCTRQAEMYVYLREGLAIDALPSLLLARTGALVEVMKLQLTPQRRLARVDVTRVLAALESPGYFLQMPPNGIVEAHLHFGD